jgi:hypothetical protein
VIWLVTAIIEVLIGIRVLLKLLAANPEAGFAQFIYGMTDVFLAAFNALLPTPSANGSVLELSIIPGGDVDLCTVGLGHRPGDVGGFGKAPGGWWWTWIYSVRKRRKLPWLY